MKSASSYTQRSCASPDSTVVFSLAKLPVVVAVGGHDVSEGGSRDGVEGSFGWLRVGGGLLVRLVCLPVAAWELE